ncbi:MAG TPA: pyruvate dehydrogenase (acetyl-transferring) E1 component subunit alpha [Candidatus Nanoarchaeia archaeon]|nr:pyruvate dehydrogenase (acetyl-transferring) E1 component subunit alpha [Candidatus Nanoarchaeia archaeon]
MIRTLKKFEIQRIEIVNEFGRVDHKLMPKLSAKQIKELYKWMILTRVFDTKAINLQRTGRLGTYASMLGQEAATIGSAYALRKQDWLFPSYRMNGGMLLRGIDMTKLYSFWGGDERGMKIDNDVNMFPLCIVVGEQMLHATGFAWGLKLKKQNAVVLTDFGDGATSTGDFHEALNFAGVFKAPVIFLCQNNKYAISVPVEKQTAAETLAQKAIAYGVRGVQVDGNDIFAVYKATQEAVQYAAKGIPTLIEADTYRRGDHTTADDAALYRKEKEVKAWEKKDPILRVRLYMEKKKIWSKTDEGNVWTQCQGIVDKAAKAYESLQKPPREDMFKYICAEGV